MNISVHNCFQLNECCDSVLASACCLVLKESFAIENFDALWNFVDGIAFFIGFLIIVIEIVQYYK